MTVTSRLHEFPRDSTGQAPFLERGFYFVTLKIRRLPADTVVIRQWFQRDVWGYIMT